MFLLGNKNQAKLDESNAVSPFALLPVNKQIRQLAIAINEQQFVIFLQPKIDLNNWQIQGVELLLRWQHPEFGLILPAQFIEPLQQSDQFEKLWAWQIHKACELNLFWQKCGLRPLRMAFNVSCSQLMRDNFLPELDRVISQVGIDHSCIELEIMDSCLFENIDEQFNSYQEIRNKGIRLALKYSTAGLPVTVDFNQLPIDAINIDKELTQQISSNRENRQIMSTILDFAHQHHIEVLAEGVETAEQLIFLNAMHCSAAQGFLLSPPLSIDKFTELYQIGKKYNDLIEKVSRQW